MNAESQLQMKKNRLPDLFATLPKKILLCPIVSNVVQAESLSAPGRPDPEFQKKENFYLTNSLSMKLSGVIVSKAEPG
jgi:hypothetical protein